jgi:hypothetical protein
LGQTSPSRPLQGFRCSSRLFRRDVAVLRTTLTGLTGLSKRSVRRSSVVWFAASSASFPRPRGLPPAGRPFGPKTARQLPQASSPSQGSGLDALPGHAWPGRPSWGFPPLQRHQRRDPYHPGLPRPAHSVPGVSHPLDGLLPLQPCGHARSAAAHGVLAPETLSDGEAGARFRARCVLSSTVLGNLEP